MKILCLDIGDVHTGTALSDELGIIATPHQTIATRDLEPWLTNIIGMRQIKQVVVGLPTTLRATESAQTIKTRKIFNQLQTRFNTATWHLWDERLSSKQANRLHRPSAKKDKLKEHSFAAAVILQAYLEYARIHNHPQD